MATPYLGEIRPVSFAFAPSGWALCNGQLLPISQNTALFSILGTTYGGDGKSTFGLPNLQGSVPIHAGGDYALGQRSGETDHTLSYEEMPEHTHNAYAIALSGTSLQPNGNLFAQPAANPRYGALYGQSIGQAVLDDRAVGIAGESQPHPNIQPSLVINFIIALEGEFPSRS